MNPRSLAVNPFSLTEAGDPVTRYERIDLGRKRWWRKLGYTPSTGTDIYSLINAALTYVYSLGNASTSRGVEIVLPYDNFTVSDTIHLYRPIRLIGASSGWDYGGTALTWDESNTSALKTFLIVHNATDDASLGRGVGSHIQDIYFIGNTNYGISGTAPPGGYSDDNPLYSGASADQVAIAGQGLELRTHCTLSRVTITQAVYDAVHVATSAVQTNANYCLLDAVDCVSTGRHGMFFHGPNGNVITAVRANATLCRRYGIYDISQHGNVIIGAHTLANYGPFYNVGGATNKTVWVGCYSESDQIESFCGTPGAVFGGTGGWGIGGATPSTGSLFGVTAPDWGNVVRNVINQSWLSTPVTAYTRPSGGGTTSISASTYYPWGLIVNAATGDLLINLEAPATANINGNHIIIGRSDSAGTTVTIRTPSGTINGGGTDLTLTAGQNRVLFPVTSLNQWRTLV